MSEKLGILIVEDERSLLHAFRALLEDEGYRVDTAEDGEEALEKLQRTPFEIVITDLKMPRMDGLDLLRRIKQATADTCVTVMTAFDTVETVGKAMRLGAYDYITKPFVADDALQLVRRAVEHVRLRSRLRDIKNERGRRYEFGDALGAFPVKRKVFEQLGTVAATDPRVLIQGEGGTGKGLVERSTPGMVEDAHGESSSGGHPPKGPRSQS